ncbi:RecF/RecN/SMC [Gautieria morchelliformis]|nr:RecF/RecN/SMC [Gautieria morchelliformis]
MDDIKQDARDSTRETDEDEISSGSSVDAKVEEDTIDQPTEETHPPIPSRVIQPEEATGPKSRLVIHKLMLINFKSYAGQQEIGPFHKSFSAIVGPNGSGKSNTIDALLFVFGNRASKLRQGKLSELIHNSANYPNLSECSVEVHFREIVDLPGPDAYTVVPDSQLVVSRIAYSNSTSKYKINGRATNREEVTTLLKGKGIDLDHNRFLILQGEVESIAQMKPKAASEHEDGLLEYLEDIIGTSHYKAHIEDALAEVDTYSEQRSEKLNRLRIVEREKNALEDKKREAEEYLKLQNEFVRAQSRLYQWYLWQCMVNEGEHADAIMKTQKLLDEETARNKDNIAHCEALQKHYDDRVTVYEEVKRHAGEVMKTLQSREKEEVSLQERKKHATGKAKKLRKSLQDDTRMKTEAQRAVHNNAEKIDKERAKLEKLEASLDEEENALEIIRDSLKDKTQVFHDEIEAKQKELVPWEAKINQTKAETDIASSEREMLSQKVEAVEKSAAEAQEALRQLTADRDAKTNELEALQVEKNNLMKESKGSQKRLQDLQFRVQDLRGKASSSRQKAEEAKASQVANTSQNNVLDSLTRLKNSGRISGFHGRLGSLGTIADKFDIAISTACPALNSLVVDQVDQGQACIEYLRKQNIGRASFMVLEKLSTNGMDAISTPENVPRLFDLIKPKDPRFAPAFFKGVGNTLVVDDLEQANRIAFSGQRRWRVVTLSGQLIDTSGTMSGGGTKVAKGGMSSKLAADSVGPDVVKRYEKESDTVGQHLEEALKELQQAEIDVDSVSKQVPKIEMTIHKVELDIQTSSKRIEEATKRAQNLKSQSKPDKGDLARISTLDQDIVKSTAELERLHKKSEVIENAIHALEDKILEVGGAKLLAQKSKVDGVKLHINLATEEITKAEVGMAKAEKDTDKFKNAIEMNTAAFEEVEQDMAKLDQQLQECSDVLDDIRSKVDAAQAAAENAKDDLEGIKGDLDEKMIGIQEFRKKEMEYNQHLEDAKKEKADNERAIHHWREKHDDLKLEEIDDDDDDDNATPSEPDAAVTAVKQEDSEGSAQTPYELHVYSVEELQNFNKKGLLADTTLLEDQIKQAQANMGALKEYRKREAEFLDRAQDLEKITARRDAHKKKYDELRKARLDEFMSGFNIISSKLKEMYQMITLGGNAELELVDSMDPFAEGIIFSVMPPKKSWKNISNLSGGEKTLSSLALVFALHVFKPTPLYFMDEIDAALDFRNVSIVANYIKDRTKNAQFIIISLRNDMFELSHRLIGIYKTSNQTRSISIDNHLLGAAPIPALRA